MGNLIIENVPDSIIKEIGTKISYKNFNSSIFQTKRRNFSDTQESDLVEFGSEGVSAKEVLNYLKTL